MKCKVPNLELLLYKVHEHLFANGKFLTIAMDKGLFGENRTCTFPNLMVIECFPQTWSSTCTGFDIDSKGEPVMAGSAFTDAYTTIVYEKHTDVYVVCFGEDVAYMVDDPTDYFYTDIWKHDMTSLSKALTRY